MKACYKCMLTLPASGFHRSARAKDGRQSRCKTCQRAATKRAPKVKWFTLVEADSGAVAWVRARDADSARAECAKSSFQRAVAVFRGRLTPVTAVNP